MADFITLDAIRVDGGTQPRASIDLALVATYAEDMARGDPFPPPVLYFDGTDHWLADGFHRVHAARQAGKGGLSCNIRQGTQRDAILYSVGANADHGWRRTNEDKRRAVLRLLHDPEWAAWSDREVARHCSVGHPLVATLRAEIAPSHLEEIPDRPRTVERAGSTYTMNTASIGRRPAAEAPALDAKPSAVTPASAPSFTPPDSTTFHADRFIHARVIAVATAVSELPAAADAARRYPAILRNSFSATQAREIADWFADFADAWEAENGARHVAA